VALAGRAEGCDGKSGEEGTHARSIPRMLGAQKATKVLGPGVCAVEVPVPRVDGEPARVADQGQCEAAHDALPDVATASTSVPMAVPSAAAVSQVTAPSCP